MAKEVDWFDREDHLTVRTCTCTCEHIFKSRARELPRDHMRQVKDSRGQPVTDSHGNVQTEKVAVYRNLSEKACPKCHSNWLKDFH